MGGIGMVTCSISISLDGFVAGPNQSMDDPIGQGGMRLHEWMFATASWRAKQGSGGGERGVDSDVVEAHMAADGAYIMGRNMFGSGRGEWDLGWSGWWGEDPPYHAPVFVLTHHPREPRDLGAHGSSGIPSGVGIDRSGDLAGRERTGVNDAEHSANDDNARDG